jgi:hypothetical protein
MPIGAQVDDYRHNATLSKPEDYLMGRATTVLSSTLLRVNGRNSIS